MKAMERGYDVYHTLRQTLESGWEVLARQPIHIPPLLWALWRPPGRDWADLPLWWEPVWVISPLWGWSAACGMSPPLSLSMRWPLPFMICPSIKSGGLCPCAAESSAPSPAFSISRSWAGIGGTCWPLEPRCCLSPAPPFSTGWPSNPGQSLRRRRTDDGWERDCST